MSMKYRQKNVRQGVSMFVIGRELCLLLIEVLRFRRG